MSTLAIAQEQKAPKEGTPLYESLEWSSNKIMGMFAILTTLTGEKFLYSFPNGKMEKTPIE